MWFRLVFLFLSLQRVASDTHLIRASNGFNDLCSTFVDHDDQVLCHSYPASVQATCQELKKHFPARTYFTNTSLYNSSNTDYWTASAALGPACVFAPTKAKDLGTAIEILGRSKTPFAVRGGGHMPIDGSNNINSTGVLLSTSSFTQLHLTHNRSRLNIGVGNRWENVYDHLLPYGRLVVGGRVGIVGVPGYFLGGGISFMANQYGWAANSVISYTAILSSGKVVTVTAKNEYSDLFWALKGGGNSFAILTNVEVKTYQAPLVTVGDSIYGSGAKVKQKWISAIVNLAVYGNQDVKHGVIPTASFVSSIPNISYTCARFYNGQNIRPAIFKNFTAPVLVPTQDTYRPQALGTYVHSYDGAVGALKGWCQRFYALVIPATVSAVTIAHDTYFDVDKRLLSGKLKGVYVTSFTAMPMPTSFITAVNARGGAPQGLEPSLGPTVWLELSTSYQDCAHESIVAAAMKVLDKELRANLAKAGQAPKSFLYLNDADGWQDVFAGYPQKNMQRLREIRRRHDPQRMFTDQMPGGWKVE